MTSAFPSTKPQISSTSAPTVSASAWARRASTGGLLPSAAIMQVHAASESIRAAFAGLISSTASAPATSMSRLSLGEPASISTLAAGVRHVCS